MLAKVYRKTLDGRPKKAYDIYELRAEALARESQLPVTFYNSVPEDLQDLIRSQYVKLGQRPFPHPRHLYAFYRSEQSQIVAHQSDLDLLTGTLGIIKAHWSVTKATGDWGRTGLTVAEKRMQNEPEVCSKLLQLL